MRTCSEQDCGRKHVARGLCGAHYNARHVTRKRVAVACTACGTLTIKRSDTGRAAQFCSPACRADHQFGTERPGRKVPSTEVVPYRRQRPAKAPDGPPSTGGRFVAGLCAWCREPFVALPFANGARYCSKRCLGYAGKNARGNFTLPPRVRLAIYERDGWVCQLCNDPVDASLPAQDPWAATLDHIECQSWADEPDHGPSNLRLAHRMCNSRRGNRVDWNAAPAA